jgi:hypothetical protein
MMPDLPNVGWERDLECFREFFENPDFRSDGLKLYPTLVIRGACVSVCVFFSGLCSTFGWLKAVFQSGHSRCVRERMCVFQWITCVIQGECVCFFQWVTWHIQLA